MCFIEIIFFFFIMLILTYFHISLGYIRKKKTMFENIKINHIEYDIRFNIAYLAGVFFFGLGY